ncbi:MAG TPA: hypothetical protein VMS98_06145 [Thermoanaerobaculia bacterium]|nr:hypothetical protein [Thermoanaerobaculia bacterium]
MDDLLLDGEGVSMELAARHANGCEACLRSLSAWNEISATARELQTSWKSDTLWPRIDRALREEKRRASRSWLWQAAAAAVLTIGIAGSAWYAVRSASHDARFDEQILRVSALDAVHQAEEAHVAAIERLERIAAPRLDESSAPLMISYREKLMLLDDAIAECEAQIGRNRQNAHLRKELLAVYRVKQKTLEEVVREGTHVSNQ